MRTFSRPLPDITLNERAPLNHSIDQVGMRGMEMLARVSDAAGTMLTLPAKIDVLVDLADKERKGIHMSRLYSATYSFFKTQLVTPQGLATLLQTLIDSQKGLSTTAALSVHFTYPIEHNALVSSTSGMRHYPATLRAEKTATAAATYSLDFRLIYSSACPCSTALAKQFIHEKLKATFPNTDSTFSKETLSTWLNQQNLLSAIPHSQRSYADIHLEFKALPAVFELAPLILNAETLIKTGVQTSVKREDEQEFARINAENLMFCEDAARIFKDYYMKDNTLKAFTITVAHLESLHAHDAVATVKHTHNP